MKVRKGGGEEIPLIQGKEQQLCFAGAAVKRDPRVQGKRNPGKRVGTERRDQGTERLRLHSRTTSQSDHTDHSLV